MDGKRPTRPSLIGLFIIIALQLGGFALIWSKDTPSPQYVYLPDTADKTSTDSPVNTPVVVVSPPDEKALRGIIQAVLEQELAASAVHNLSNSSNKKENPSQVSLTGAEENSPENLQAFERIKNIVDNAIANGKWTLNDTVIAAPYSRNITENQRTELLDKIGAAINSQSMELTPEAPPHF